jgi:cell division protein FtsB
MMMENNVVKRKKSNQLGRGYRGVKETGDSSTRRLEKSVDVTRRLHLVEDGRREVGTGVVVSRPRVRDKRGVKKEIRRRRRLAALFLALSAAGLITYLLLGPITRAVESRGNLSRAEAQLQEERSRTQALEERKSRALTEDFVEEEARKMGYVKPGEIPIIVLDEPEAEQVPDTAAVPAPNP